MVSDKYRMHRLRQGDEWALATLAKGNARFGDQDRPWVPPLSSEEAAEFVADPRTICVVAIDMGSNHMAGFVYGGVLYRRHTKLRHLCVYEVGVDIDHRTSGVGQLLMESISAEALQMGIEQGFAFAPSGDRESQGVYESIGAVTGTGTETLFALKF